MRVLYSQIGAEDLRGQGERLGFSIFVKLPRARNCFTLMLSTLPLNRPLPIDTEVMARRAPAC